VGGDEARLFVAFGISDEAADHLGAAGAGLDGRFFRLLKRDNYHVTLAFLGDTPAESFETIRECLGDAANESRVFDAALGGPGAFPHAGEPRVVWYGLAAGTRESGNLAFRVRSRLKKAGISFDGKPFRPHITLAYLRKGLGRDETRAAGESFTDYLKRRGRDGGASAEVPAFAVREILLVKSDLRPGGSVFTVLARFPLSGIGDLPQAH